MRGPAFAGLLLFFTVLPASAKVDPEACLRDVEIFRAFIADAMDRLEKLEPPARPEPLARAAVEFRNLNCVGALEILERNRDLEAGKNAGLYRYLRARSLGLTGRYDEAHRYLLDSLEQYPKDAWVWNALRITNVYAARDTMPRAKVLEGIRGSTGNPALREYALAVQEYYRAISGSVENPGEIDAKGMEKAARRFISAIDKDPRGDAIEIDQYKFLLSALRCAGKPEWCEAMVRVMLIEKPAATKNWPMDLELVNLTPEQIAGMEKKLRSDPRMILYHLDLYSSGVQDEAKLEQGIARARKALASGDCDARFRCSIRYKLAYLQIVMADNAGALKTYQDLLKDNPHYAQVHLNISWLHAQAGDFSKAADAALEDMRINWRGRGRTALAYSGLHGHLVSAKRFDDAAKYALDGIRHLWETPERNLELLLRYAELTENEEARKAKGIGVLRRELRVQSNGEPDLKILDALQASRSGKHARALEMAEPFAMSLAIPDTTVDRILLGNLILRVTQAAIASKDESIAGLCFEIAGRVYASQGRRKEALDFLKRAHKDHGRKSAGELYKMLRKVQPGRG